MFAEVSAKTAEGVEGVFKAIGASTFRSALPFIHLSTFPPFSPVSSSFLFVSLLISLPSRFSLPSSPEPENSN